MISIRKKENETIIIQNFKREYLPIFSFFVGAYCILNLLSMIRIDINLSYKFFLVGFGGVFLWYGFKAYTKEKLLLQVFMLINIKEFRIEVKEMKGVKKEKVFLLNDIEKITVKNRGKIFDLILKLKDNTEEKPIWEAYYSSDLRLIKRIILEYKAKEVV